MRCTLLLLIFVLSGCSTYVRLRQFSNDDKIASMRGTEEIIVKQKWPAQSPSTNDHSLRADISNYLNMLTGIVFTSEDIDENDIKISEVENKVEEPENGAQIHLTYTFDFEFASEGSRGCAVLVSNDGYFLTAAHVVNIADGRLLFGTIDPKAYEVHPQVLEYEIIYLDEKLDFAILKTELTNPAHLYLSKKIPESGEAIFNGGSTFSSASRGTVKEVIIREGSTQRPESFSILTDAPFIKGDSGSACVNANGDIVAIATEFQLRNWKRYSKFSMLPADAILEIIDQHRRNHPHLSDQNLN